uniref:Uncharacterized protein n=1 Tax=Taeniopygia guttata TaxID=59729 RepID=A0A674H157_TAEGU
SSPAFASPLLSREITCVALDFRSSLNQKLLESKVRTKTNRCKIWTCSVVLYNLCPNRWQNIVVREI